MRFEALLDRQEGGEMSQEEVRPATLGDLVRQGYDGSAYCGACGHYTTTLGFQS